MYNSIVSIMRDLSVLLFAQVVLESLQPSTVYASTTGVLLDVKVAPRSDNPFTSYIPASMIAPIEAFAVSSIIVVAISFVSQIITNDTTKSCVNSAPELDRLLLSVQWLFADTVAYIFIDKDVQWDVSVIGLIGIVKLSEFIHMGTNTAAHIWLGGVSMAW